MVVFGAVLLVVSLALLALVVLVVISEQTPEPSTDEPDLAAPYRAGLHAANRLQGVALDLERELYAKAEASGSHATEEI